MRSTAPGRRVVHVKYVDGDGNSTEKGDHRGESELGFVRPIVWATGGEHSRARIAYLRKGSQVGL